MSQGLNTITRKIIELEDELKNTGIWEQTVLCTLPMHEVDNTPSTADFIQWLRFDFIPNHLQKKKIANREKRLLVPHAIKYFGEYLHKGKLLQILIELDSLL